MYDNHLVQSEGITKLKYGYASRFETETKEEAVERIYNQLANNNFVISDCWSSSTPFVKDNKLFYNYQNHLKKFTDVFDSEWENDEVLSIVEARIVKELLEQYTKEKARREAEEAAAQAERDKAKKAKYLAWKEEAERLGISFSDLCDMKRAEMEEYFY